MLLFILYRVPDVLKLISLETLITLHVGVCDFKLKEWLFYVSLALLHLKSDWYGGS